MAGPCTVKPPWATAMVDQAREAMIEEIRFAEDSPLEEGGFELVVPL
jgi:hypothetical protein